VGQCSGRREGTGRGRMEGPGAVSGRKGGRRRSCSAAHSRAGEAGLLGIVWFHGHGPKSLAAHLEQLGNL
jgi:hypothetical protein